MSEYKRIWLEPEPGSDPDGGRMWAENDVWGDGTEYVLASDVAAALAAAEERGRIEERERCAKIAIKQAPATLDFSDAPLQALSKRIAADTMTRPTILDRDDVAVVRGKPLGYITFLHSKKGNWHLTRSRLQTEQEAKAHKEHLQRLIDDQHWHDDYDAISRLVYEASPHSSAWQEVREYVAASDARIAELEAFVKEEGERGDYWFDLATYDVGGAPRLWKDRAENAEATEVRIAALELRLAEAERVIEPFAREATAWEKYEDGEPLVEGFPEYYGHLSVADLRAARAWKEGK